MVALATDAAGFAIRQLGGLSSAHAPKIHRTTAQGRQGLCKRMRAFGFPPANRRNHGYTYGKRFGAIRLNAKFGVPITGLET